MRAPRTHRRNSSRRGAIFLEALLVLPVLILFLYGARFTGQLALQKLRAKSEARSCAWRIASSGCQLIPEDCDPGLLQNEAHLDAFQNLNASLITAYGETEEELPVDAALTSAIEGFFFQRVTLQTSRKVEKPPLFGGQTLSIEGSYSLPCNSRNGDVLDIATEIFQSLTPR